MGGIVAELLVNGPTTTCNTDREDQTHSLILPGTAPILPGTAPKIESDASTEFSEPGR